MDSRDLLGQAGVLIHIPGSQAGLGEPRMETAEACAGACGAHRKLLRADTKDPLVLLHHCTDGDPGSHSPSVEWDGHITSKYRLLSLQA